MLPKKLLSVFFFIIICVTGCSDPDPSLIDITATVVFEFADYTSSPSCHLSFFVRPFTEAERAACIRIVNMANGQTWSITNPRVISSKGKSWAGYTKLYPVQGESIQKGAYALTYEDVAEREYDTTFSVSYPDELLKDTANTAVDKVSKSTLHNIALYDSDGVLSYFGVLKKDVKSVSELKKLSSSAVSYRMCYTSADKTYMCVMPLKSVEVFDQEF